MKLRNLELKDASFMLEWMHDNNVVCDLKGNFLEKTIKDAESFILASADKRENIHLAIVTEEDEYMGTVSLKNIENGTAEFGIAVRQSAMRKGFSWFGMKEILRLAFEECRLYEVYWCVSRDNKRAIRFYDKHGFKELVDVPSIVLSRYQNSNNLKWYFVKDSIALRL